MTALALNISNVLINQDSVGRFCLNDLHKASGSEKRHQPSDWLRIQQTQELIAELENYEPGIPGTKNQAIEIIQGKGKAQGTYAVKELVYAYAMWISAKFHIAVIRAYDALVTQSDYGLKQLPEPATINKAQIGVLFNQVNAICSGSGKIRAELWSRFQNHFKLASYKDLPADRFDDAKAYLDAKHIEYNHGVEMLWISRSELNAMAQTGELLDAPKTDHSNTITIGLDSGVTALSLIFEGKTNQHQRYLVDVFLNRVNIQSAATDSYLVTADTLADLISQPGQIERQYLKAIIQAAAARLH